jgi:hypothetical protein
MTDKSNETHQTKLSSLFEVVINVFLGFTINTATAIVVLPLFGVHLSVILNIKISAAMTVVSVIRSYFIRRLFDKYQTKVNEITHTVGHKIHSIFLYNASVL